MVSENKPKYHAWYECIYGCSRFQLTELKYRCPRCNSLLQVRHDLDAIRQKQPQEWKSLFRHRAAENGPHGSGVWEKREWVCPLIDEKNIVSVAEGHTPLLPVTGITARAGVGQAYLKLCGNSHTGSFKDLGMTVLVSMVKQIVAEGRQIKAIVAASTGDTSAALAAYCARAGLPSVVLLPKDKVSVAQLIQPVANGTLTLSLNTDFDGCMKVVQALSKSAEFYLANSMNSLRVEGQKTVSFEIAEQLQWHVPDWVVVPGGNLGNISAIGKGFAEMLETGLIDRVPRLICAQTEKANPLYRMYMRNFENYEPVPAQPSFATAIQIGNPVSIEKAVKTLTLTNGMVEAVSESELADATALTDREGVFVCPQTGVAVAAFLKLAQRGVIGRQDTVVIVSTAHGLKFVDFKVRYQRDQLPGIAPQFRNEPIELPPQTEAVIKEIDGFLERES